MTKSQPVIPFQIALQDLGIEGRRTYSRRGPDGTVWETQRTDHGTITSPTSMHWPCGCVTPVEVVWCGDGRMMYTNWPPPRGLE